MKNNARVYLETKEFQGKTYQVLVVEIDNEMLGTIKLNTRGIRLTDVEKKVIEMACEK